MTDVDLDLLEDTPPREFDHDAEVAVVGAVMRSRGRALDDVNLTAEHFGDPLIGAAFARAAELHAAHGFVDFVSFGDSLTRRPIPGVTAHDLITAERNTPAVASAEFYARIVRDWAIRRGVVAAGSWLCQTARTADDVDALADEARARIDAAVAGRTVEVHTIASSMFDTLEELEQPDVHTPTPWPSVDQFIGGLRPGALYVVGARPGKGKSIVGAMLALSTARHGKWAAVSSLEMSRHELNRRWIAQAGRVSLGAMESRRMSQADWAAASEVAHKLVDLPIAVDDRGSATVWDVRHHARTVARRGELGMVLVDYLQLMNAPRTSERRSRQEQVAEMSRSMKQLAQELAVPVVCLSQLNRGAEAHSDGRPRLSDLRESGAVEQDSDVVILLHRDEDKNPDVLSVAIAKNRHGTTGACDLQWQGHYARVVERQWSPSTALETSA